MLKASDTALAVIDVQGKLATLMHDRDTLYRNLQILVRGARVLELPVLWLEQYPEGLGPTIPEVAELLGGQEPLAKTCFSAWGQPEFVGRLEESGRRQVLVAGIETHICVYQTVRDLRDRGYEVEVVEDAVSSRTASEQARGTGEGEGRRRRDHLGGDGPLRAAARGREPRVPGDRPAGEVSRPPAYPKRSRYCPSNSSEPSSRR